MLVYQYTLLFLKTFYKIVLLSNSQVVKSLNHDQDAGLGGPGETKVDQISACGYLQLGEGSRRMGSGEVQINTSLQRRYPLT